jgi:hypothetical protein
MIKKFNYVKVIKRFMLFIEIEVVGNKCGWINIGMEDMKRDKYIGLCISNRVYK